MLLRPSRLSTKLNFLVIAVILLTSVSIAVLISQRQIEKGRDDLLNLGVNLAELGARYSEFALYTGEAGALQSATDNLLSNAKIAYVQLLNKKHEPVSTKAASGDPQAVPKADETLFQGGTQQTEVRIGASAMRCFDIVAPVKGHGASDMAELFPDMKSAADQVIGYVRVGVTQDSLLATTRDFVVSVVAITALVVALGMLMTLLITRRIVGPIQVLVRATHEVAEGNLSALVVTKPGGEIGELASSFRRMIVRLRDYRDQVEEARATLEAKVEERTRELQRASKEAQALARQAEEANRAKSQFLANMSHEIRTPMNGVLGMAELLMESELSTKQRRYVQTVRSSGEALLSIINDILDFSKIEAGRLELESVDFCISDLAEDVAELLAESADRKGLELLCRIDEAAIGYARGDPGRLRQVLVNLAGNAIKFTQSGNVIITVAPLASPPQFFDAANPQSSAKAAQTKWIRFAVQDTGIGIESDALQRLFQPFTQADTTMARKYGGTGLGLAISRQLVQMMGGRLEVQSVPGKGSTFCFDLPLEIGQEHSPVSGAPDLHGVRVLIVDDNPMNREILCRQAVAAEMLVEMATDGVAGLEAMRDAAQKGRPFDVVIIDMKMPKMDGLTLASEIERDSAIAGVQRIMLSSLHTIGELAEAHNLGVRYLTKPVRRQELYRCIAEAVHASTMSPDATAPVKAPLPAISARVLLAEDNPVNRAVAQAMLDSYGCDFDVAVNGFEAVQAVRRRAYDIILMDCQMPEMDGLTAARQIRDMESKRQTKSARDTGGSRARLPIIALTANALAGDREACLAAGMDDYLAKPFTGAELRTILERWLKTEGIAAETTANALSASDATTVPSEQKTEPMLDSARLQMLRALQQPDAPNILEQAIGLFFEETPRLLEKMRTAFAQGDVREAATAAHSLKSSSRNLGASKLGELCQRLERAGRAGIAEGGETVIAEIATEYARVRPLLEAEIVKGDA